MQINYTGEEIAELDAEEGEGITDDWDVNVELAWELSQLLLFATTILIE